MKPHALLVVSLLATVGFAAPMRVAATTSGLEFTAEEGAGKTSLPLGAVVNVYVHGKVVYAALLQGGVAVVNAENPKAPVLVGKIAEGRRISNILFVDGKLLLVETRQEVLAFDVGNALAPVATSLTAPSQMGLEREPTKVVVSAPAVEPEIAPTARAAKVLQVLQGRVVVDAGSKEGFVAGKRIKIVSQKQVMKPDLVSGGTRLQASNETTAVLTLEQSEDTRSMSLLGRGDVAKVGDLVYLTDEALTERIFLPRRSPFNIRTGFHVRPFLGLEATGTRPVGFLADVYGAYYFDEIPFMVEFSVSPFGTVVGGRDPHNPVTFSATAAYTTDFFEIGLGVGGLGGRAGPCTKIPGADELCQERTGLTINQVLRLGALDGLNFLWRSSIFLGSDAFKFGYGRGEINLPLSRRFSLFAGGGGGLNGWVIAEILGVRSYFGGTGARGTHVVSAGLGVSTIDDGPTAESVTGPAVSFGWEWRL